MKREKIPWRGFTLIELLVVIAIIALLMTILMPVLQKVRRSSKAVVCQGNLRQWGVLFSTYLAEHDGWFFPLDCPYADPYRRDYESKSYFFSTRDLVTNYFEHDRELLLCPMAPLTKARESEILNNTGDCGGSTNTPWFYRTAYWDGRVEAIVEKPVFGSYGLNPGVRTPIPAYRPDHDIVCPYTINPRSKGTSCDYHFARGHCWNSWQSHNANIIPVLMDCKWCQTSMSPFQYPPPYEDTYYGYCINRHDGYINGLFADMSVRKVGLKELWTLKWNRTFDTAGPWTKAGRVRPEDWPQWMQGFKDY